MNKSPEVLAYYQELARRMKKARWDTRTKKQKSDHGKLMVAAREAKRKLKGS